MQGMEELMRQAQAMQTKMAEMQQELANKRVEGSSGGGMVRAVATGKQEIVSVSIEKSVVDPGEIDMLQDLVTAAVNDALRRSRELAEKDMSALAGGLKIPGLF